MNDIDRKINELIESNISTNSRTGISMYKNRFAWNSKMEGASWEQFKAHYPNAYRNAYNKLFDELHPF